MLAVYIATKNSPSGNPQRGWIIFNDSGAPAGFVDEEYYGRDALKMAGWGAIPFTTARITVQPAEYHAWKRSHPKRNSKLHARQVSALSSKRGSSGAAAEAWKGQWRFKRGGASGPSHGWVSKNKKRGSRKPKKRTSRGRRR